MIENENQSSSISDTAWSHRFFFLGPLHKKHLISRIQDLEAHSSQLQNISLYDLDWKIPKENNSFSLNTIVHYPRKKGEGYGCWIDQIRNASGALFRKAALARKILKSPFVSIILMGDRSVGKTQLVIRC